MECFEDNEVVLPMTVLEELDNLKKEEGEKGANVRKAIRILETHRGNPAGVMENIFGVTEYLRNVVREEGGDPDRETLSCIKTKNGCTFFEDSEGQP